MREKVDFSRFRWRGATAELRRRLLEWYDHTKDARGMPWRKISPPDPYAIWLSETMLQQTQVATVIPYFERFLARFPTVLALSKAPFDEILRLWAGLGYYRRAKHLHAAARMVAEKFGGKMPATVEGLLALPGVGRYTAGAVASMAFGQAEPVVDGNVKRVVARLTGFEGDIGVVGNQAFFWERAGEVVVGGDVRDAECGMRRDEGTKDGDMDTRRMDEDKDKDKEQEQDFGRYGDVNQAVMELGATVCVPGRPLCMVCPVREFCVAYAEGRQEALPVKGKKGAVPEVRGVAVVVMREGAGSEKQGARSKKQEAGGEEQGAIGTGREVLLMRRPMGGVWEGMWEFPVMGERVNVIKLKVAKLKVRKEGGRGAGIGALRQRIERELGVRVGELRRCGEVVHVLTHRRMVYEVVVVAEKQEAGSRRRELKLPACREGGQYEEMRWVSWEGLVKGEVGEQGVAMARVVGRIVEAVSSENDV